MSHIDTQRLKQHHRCLYYGLTIIAWLMPFKLLRGLGWCFGYLAYIVNKKRRLITYKNFSIAYPDLTHTDYQRLTREHLQYMGMALFDRVWLWFAPLKRTYSRLTLEGVEHLPSSIESQGVILFVPHFVGLEAAGAAWVAYCKTNQLNTPYFVSIFQSQSTDWEDALYRYGRGRFADIEQYIRQEGIRPVIKAIRQGRHFYCLPDNDHGEKDSVFVPFFGLNAATLTVLPKLSHLLNANIVPLTACMTPQGYTVHVHPAWSPLGKKSIEVELTQINQQLELWIRTMPTQYLFSHRRYKTRPVGESSIY